MKKTRFSEEQMVTILREADQRPVLEVAEKHGLSAQCTFRADPRFECFAASGGTWRFLGTSSDDEIMRPACSFQTCSAKVDNDMTLPTRRSGGAFTLNRN